MRPLTSGSAMSQVNEWESEGLMNFTMEQLDDMSSPTGMQAANGIFLTFAMINFFAMWGKLGVYVYFIVGFDKFKSLFDAFISFSSMSLQEIANLTSDLSNFGDAFSWPFYAGILYGGMINFLGTMWPMFFYQRLDEAEEPKFGAMIAQYNTFWWIWLLIGWGEPLLYAMNWILPDQGTGFEGMDAIGTYLIVGSIGLYGATMFFLMGSRGMLMDMYSKVQVEEGMKLLFLVDIMKGNKKYSGPVSFTPVPGDPLPDFQPSGGRSSSGRSRRESRWLE